MHRLAKKMSGCFLRRTKTFIKGQLPKKEDRVRTVFVCIINYSSQFFFFPEKHFFLGFLLLHVGFQKTSTELSFISFLVLLPCLPLGLQLVRVLVSFLLPWYILEISHCKRRKDLFWFHRFQSMHGSLYLWPVGEHGGASSTSQWQEGERDRKGTGAQYPLEGHSLSDLSFFWRLHMSKATELGFGLWVYGGPLVSKPWQCVSNAYLKSGVEGHSFNPSTKTQAGEFLSSGQSGVHGEFQASEVYSVKPFLKN